jgi:hypothetical protein
LSTLNLPLNSITQGYTFTELEELVQASSNQIIGLLKSINAVQYKGKWALLNKEYEAEVLEYLITTIRAGYIKTQTFF